MRPDAPDVVAYIDHIVMGQIVELEDRADRQTNPRRVDRRRRAQGRNRALARGEGLVTGQAADALHVAVGQAKRNEVSRADCRNGLRRVRLTPEVGPVPYAFDSLARADVAQDGIDRVEVLGNQLFVFDRDAVGVLQERHELQDTY